MKYFKFLGALVLIGSFVGCSDNAAEKMVTGPVMSEAELAAAKKVEQIYMARTLTGMEREQYIESLKPTVRWNGHSRFNKGVRYHISADQQMKAQELDENYRKMYLALKQLIAEKETSGKAKRGRADRLSSEPFCAASADCPGGWMAGASATAFHEGGHWCAVRALACVEDDCQYDEDSGAGPIFAGAARAGGGGRMMVGAYSVTECDNDEYCSDSQSCY
jgi:hypothetical protein